MLLYDIANNKRIQMHFTWTTKNSPFWNRIIYFSPQHYIYMRLRFTMFLVFFFFVWIWHLCTMHNAHIVCHIFVPIADHPTCIQCIGVYQQRRDHTCHRPINAKFMERQRSSSTFLGHIAIISKWNFPIHTWTKSTKWIKWQMTHFFTLKIFTKIIFIFL